MLIPFAGQCVAVAQGGQASPLPLRRKIGKLVSYHLPFWSGVALKGEHECTLLATQRPLPCHTWLLPPSPGPEMSGCDPQGPFAALSSGLQGRVTRQWPDPSSERMPAAQWGCARHPLVGGTSEGIGGLSSPPAHFFLRLGKGLLSPMNVCVWYQVKRVEMNKERARKQPPCGSG